ncbi:MAG: glycine cleavage system aminomethyltransferase GcvT [SAR202 cluster bacterium]|nr:glycine cleavage system aminomethyltransferase GcvT [SAR202 cluster bacterium]
MDQTNQTLKRTPLYETHIASGARMVPFGGWDMPVQYTSILEEAKAVRTASGIFDVSHMGRVKIEGLGAAAFISSIFSFDVSTLKIGRAKYGVICNEQGGIIDDCIVYRRGDDRYLLVPNAGNLDRVMEWIAQWAPAKDKVKIDNISNQFAMVALQGPKAAELLAGLTKYDVASIRPFAIAEFEVAGIPAIAGRTGYTGEDGFEVIASKDKAAKLWQTLKDRGARECGLGARDVLRLEAGLPLHGNDMNDTVNPYEASVERFIDIDREGYIPRKALIKARDNQTRKLVGFQMVGKGIPRHGYDITDGTKKIGEVTSGGVAPTIDKNIGMGFVPVSMAAEGTRFQVDVRGRMIEAEVVPLPFYRRKKA